MLHSLPQSLHLINSQHSNKMYLHIFEYNFGCYIHKNVKKLVTTLYAFSAHLCSPYKNLNFSWLHHTAFIQRPSSQSYIFRLLVDWTLIQAILKCYTVLSLTKMKDLHIISKHESNVWYNRGNTINKYHEQTPLPPEDISL